MKTACTLKEVRRDVATVGLEAKMERGADDEGAERPPVEIKVLSGTQTGTVRLSTVNAALSTVDVRQDLRMSVTARGQTIEMTVKGNTTTRVTRM
jgi:hypothetical protein